jgi:hypothetical protein
MINEAEKVCWFKANCYVFEMTDKIEKKIPRKPQGKMERHSTSKQYGKWEEEAILI